MLEDMQLRGLSARTQEAYARAVWQLAQYYHRRPDQLSEEELRQYFLYLATRRRLPGPRPPSRFAGSSSSMSPPSNANHRTRKKVLPEKSADKRRTKRPAKDEPLPTGCLSDSLLKNDVGKRQAEGPSAACR